MMNWIRFISVLMFSIATTAVWSAGDAENDDVKPAAKQGVKKKATRGFKPSTKIGVETARLELGYLPETTEADGYHSLQVSPYVLWKPSREWEARAGVRVDGMWQHGQVDHSEATMDYTDTYVRYRTGDTRLTLGAQTVIWGRIDEFPPSDRLSRVDLTRFILDDLTDRRRAQFSARVEQTWGDTKLDALWVPFFRGAELPDSRSIWNPVNRTSGRILGVSPAFLPAALVQAGHFDDDDGGSGGFGARLTRTGEAADYGLTLAYARQSMPYYELTAIAPTPVFVGRHPYSKFLGGDFEIKAGGAVWRLEAGYSSDVPVTDVALGYLTVPALDAVGAVEFFPGGKDTRVNLQVVAHHLITERNLVDLSEYYSFNGEVVMEFGNARWKFDGRFNIGINVSDVYINPMFSYLGWEPHEVYVAYHYFDGNARTLGGFHENHSMVAVGVRTRF